MPDQTFTIGPLPPGVAPPTTTADRAIYRKALDLEGVFTQHLVDAMMQILGGMGMAKELPLESWFRALRVARVVEGPSEIHRYLLAREILGPAAIGKRP